MLASATAALISLGSESLDSCVDRILDPNNRNWEASASAMLYLGTNAARVIPRLARAFEVLDDEELKGRIAFPLRFIRSEPQLNRERRARDSNCLLQS